MILFTLDASGEVDETDLRIFKLVDKKDVIIVLNKIDLKDYHPYEQLPNKWGAYPKIFTSALHNKGIDELKKLIGEFSTREQEKVNDLGIIPNLRQNTAIAKSLKFMKISKRGFIDGNPFELIACDISQAIEYMDQILGITTEEDVLDRVFKQFCIGK